MYYCSSEAVKQYPNEQMLGRRVTVDSKVKEKLYNILVLTTK